LSYVSITLTQERHVKEFKFFNT